LFWVFRKLDQFIVGEGGAIGEKRGGANTGHKQELAHEFPPDTLVRGACDARFRGGGALSFHVFPAGCQDAGKPVKVSPKRHFPHQASVKGAAAPRF
jgi:hypothetical protein